MNATKAMTVDTPVSVRRTRVRGLSVRAGAAMLVWFIGWSLSGAAPEPTPGVPSCREASKGTTVDFLTGLVCPPGGFRESFGYEPVLVKTPAGWRYTRPAHADGRCNGPLGALGGTGAFVTACQSHDYGYDLVRFGIGVRSEADELLYRDMMTICVERGPWAGSACRCLAHWTKTVLQVGDAVGFEPKPVPLV